MTPNTTDSGQGFKAALGSITGKLRESLADPESQAKVDARIAAQKAADEAAEAEKRRRHAAFLAREAGGGRCHEYRFDTYKVATDHQTKVFQLVREWAETLPERIANCESLVLYGACGTGKDHLAFAAARLGILKYGVTVTWRNGRNLAADFRDGINEGESETDKIRELRADNLLVLSDPLPVSGKLTDFQVDVLYRVLDARYAANRPMIVTLNAIDESDADKRLGPPLWDRIQDRAWIAHCNWPSHRKPGRVVK